MEHKPAIYALVRLHAELGGKIKDNRREAKRLAQDMKHVEAVLKMLEPDFNLRGISTRRRYERHAPFTRGKGTRHIMDTLRVATEPLTSSQIAEAVLQKGGIAEPSPKEIAIARGSVHSTLRRYQGKSVEAVGEGFPIRWRLLG
ncbi:MAG TPA: hypothetical protein VN802_21955 [Stellaceae bacterium]|nr:hypothetical protein [Stellaceae bacterium]